MVQSGEGRGSMNNNVQCGNKSVAKNYASSHSPYNKIESSISGASIGQGPKQSEQPNTTPVQHTPTAVIPVPLPTLPGDIIPAVKGSINADHATDEEHNSFAKASMAMTKIPAARDCRPPLQQGIVGWNCQPSQ